MSYKYVLNQCKLFLLLPPFCNGLISTCKSMNFSWFNTQSREKVERVSVQFALSVSAKYFGTANIRYSLHIIAWLLFQQIKGL